ncbi:MAG TPA: hypothetical protein VMJ34_22500 [Bryobacteraceae bacterium]|nr:hypothetical protein [Bryobacteraceae bacterium]
MQFDAVIWVLLPVFIAGGSALLSFFIMSARMEVAVAKEREAVAETKATLRALEATAQEKIKAAEQEARRKSLDDFMQDFRVEERHYVRENKSLLMHKKSVVLQERLYFRNIPLSNWVEHEMTVEEGGDPAQSVRGASVFSTRALSDEQQGAASRLLGKGSDDGARTVSSYSHVGV